MNETLLFLVINSVLSAKQNVRDTAKHVLSVISSEMPVNVIKFCDHALKVADETGFPLTRETAGPYAPFFDNLVSQGQYKPAEDESTILYAMYEYNKKKRGNQLSAILLEALRILKTGAGLDAAVTYLAENRPVAEVTILDRESDTLDLAGAYDDAKTGKNPGLKTGITRVDSATEGIKIGEMWVIGAYTGHGKTFSLLNAAWDMRVKQKKRILYWSTESAALPLLIRLTARHSLEFVTGGLKSWDIENGLLNEMQEAVYKNQVIPDWRDSYPKMIFRRAPYMATLEEIYTESLAVANKYGDLDIIIIDYLSQLDTATRYTSLRERVTQLLIQTKQMALNFGGEGIRILTAGQTNASSMMAAIDSGHYNIRTLAETAEYERSADVLYTLLRSPELRTDRLIGVDLLKNRRGIDNTYFTIKERFDVGAVLNAEEDSGQSSLETWNIDVY